ncbi:MAG: hypothetical protein WBA89_02920 [Microcoleus sp.]
MPLDKERASIAAGKSKIIQILNYATAVLGCVARSKNPEVRSAVSRVPRT